MSDEGTYGITGIPAPKDVKYLTDKIPYVPGLPIRKEISVLATPSESDVQGQQQWTLFVLALERFKGLPVDKKLSYFQVAGIHSYPLVSWDQGKPTAGKGGYCTHNTVTFSTWHRVYMLLYEQLLWKNMLEIIEGWSLSDTEKAQWKKSADTFRLPYWDWATKQTYTRSFALPSVLTENHVEIHLPESIKDQYENPENYPNPLYGFDNPEVDENGDPRKLGDMPPGKELWNIPDHDKKKVGHRPANPGCLPWSVTTGTGRWAIQIKPGKRYTGLDGVNNFIAANQSFATSEQWFRQAPGNLSESVNRMFTGNKTWGTFASTKWFKDQRDPEAFSSLEALHNTLVTGGSDFKDGVGHMSDVPVAAFDPIFWLHHCQIDRLLAIWQSLNWDLWWDKLEPGPNPEKPDKEPVKEDAKPKDPLPPFHTKTDGNPATDNWTSELCRDWTKYGYQYGDLLPSKNALNPDGTLNEDVYKIELLAYINRAYPGAGQVIAKIRADDDIKVPRGLPEPKGQPFDDYVINVDYDRFALDGTSYSIRFFLGGPKNVAKTNYKDENYIGEVFTFTGPLAARGSNDGCANCRAQADAGVLSQAQVPITIALVNHIFDQEGDHPIKNFNEVGEYLRLHLNWKFVQHGGLVLDASRFPQTKISVMRGTGKPRQEFIQPAPAVAAAAAEGAFAISALSVANTQPVILPPTYSHYEAVYEATEGKDWGLGRDDA